MSDPKPSEVSALLSAIAFAIKLGGLQNEPGWAYLLAEITEMLGRFNDPTRGDS